MSYLLLSLSYSIVSNDIMYTRVKRALVTAAELLTAYALILALMTHIPLHFLSLLSVYTQFNVYQSRLLNVLTLLQVVN